MSLILKTFWLWPQCIWRFLFRVDTTPMGKGSCQNCNPVLDMQDLEVFKHAQLSEIREGRSVNFLRLPRRRAESCDVQNSSLQDKDDTVIFFVHGSMANMLQYEFQVDYFWKAGKYTVVTFDAYGCGSSPKPKDKSAYSHDEMFADLVTLFRREKGRRNIVVGHSYGTSMALQLAAHEKEAAVSAGGGADSTGGIDALVLLAPAFGPDHYPKQSLKMIAPLLRHGFISRALHRETRQGKTDLHRRLIARVQAASGSNPMHVCQAFYTQMKWVDAAVARQSACPTLVLCGDADAMTPLGWAQALVAELKKDEHRLVELGVVAQCSHQLMQERPDEVNKLLSDFFSRVPALADP